MTRAQTAAFLAPSLGWLALFLLLPCLLLLLNAVLGADGAITLERFRAIFKDAGVQAQKGGEKLGDAAEKLSEWLRSREGFSESE